MDFKTRFQGKMTRISKDGGIEDVVKSTSKPINRVEKVTIRSLQPDATPTQQTESSNIAAATTTGGPSPKITYGNTSQASRFQQHMS